MRALLISGFHGTVFLATTVRETACGLELSIDHSSVVNGLSVFALARLLFVRIHPETIPPFYQYLAGVSFGAVGECGGDSLGS